MIKIATMSLIPTHLLNALIYDLPNPKAYRSSFEVYGMTSTVFVDTMGFTLWLLAVYFFLLIIYFIFKCVKPI